MLTLHRRRRRNSTTSPPICIPPGVGPTRTAPTWLMTVEDWTTLRSNEGAGSIPDVVLVENTFDNTHPYTPEHYTPAQAEVRLVEIKYCRDSDPTAQLERAKVQHAGLQKRLEGKGFKAVTIHPILLGVGGTVYQHHTLAQLEALGISRTAANKTMHKLNRLAANHAAALVGARRRHEHDAGQAG